MQTKSLYSLVEDSDQGKFTKTRQKKKTKIIIICLCIVSARCYTTVQLFSLYKPASQ